ncbi:MAG TPA: hypothetical protein V6C95_06425 [Coleofasciculaceae cyanobacterium]
MGFRKLFVSLCGDEIQRMVAIRPKEQAMSRGVSDEPPELRSFSTDLLCEAGVRIF